MTRNRWNYYWLRLVTSFVVLLADAEPTQPNIIFILADDLGWNDVSYNGMNEILTPNLATLAGAGVLLNNYYVQPVCSPSRAALLTGRYAIYTGLNHWPFTEGQPYGLSLNFTLLPQYLKKLGYQTHMVGKIYRGFDTHYGYWGGVVDYFQKTVSVQPKNVVNVPDSEKNHSIVFVGYDLKDNMKPVEDDAQEYLVDLLTKRATKIIRQHDQTKPLFLYVAQIAVHAPPDTMPLRSPSKYRERFQYISYPLRKNFAGVLTALDESVGSVMEALGEAKMLDNTIVIFSSDNGADLDIFPNGGSNYPLRGSKGSVFEGGIRASGIVWSPLLNNMPRVSNDLMHMTDWLPSLYAAAGGNADDIKDIDGINQWPMISTGSDGTRNDLLINIDPIFNVSSYRQNNFKIVLGRFTQYNVDNWYGPTGNVPDYQSSSVPYNNKVEKVLRKYYRTCRKTWRPDVKRLNCTTPPNVPKDQCMHSPCLFDLASDPCENNDLSISYPQKTQELLSKMNWYRATMVAPIPQVVDYNSDPLKHCGLWTTWLDSDQNNLKCCGPINDSG